MKMMTRRQALQATGLGLASLVLGNVGQAQAGGPFTLPELPYAYDALAPKIDKETMTIHHDRHHKAYVDNLNAAVAGHADLAKMSIDAILRNIDKVPQEIRQRVINNGGGHYNHTMFWQIMGPGGARQPQGNLAQAINSTFGNFDKFKGAFKQACLDRFGSGWGWLVKSADGKLSIISTANQDCPLMTGQMPILGCDVWEHAYYIGYRNRRPDYIDAWWDVVNWTAVGQRF